jgi:two-component system CheB/CheR fusion protein
VVGIGASAGGLEAFTQLLKHLPPDTGMAFVLIQHLDPTHQSLLPELLSKATRMPVMQVTDGIVVKPNQVYVIPPASDMEVRKSSLYLTRRKDPRAPRMPIDVFLRSLAGDRRSGAIGVILSGTASDGVIGLTAIKAEGGVTFAQDERSAHYGGMPHSAAAAGVVDFVLPPEGIAKELARIGRHPFLRPIPAPTEEPAPGSDTALHRIFFLLRTATGVDFTHYKKNTVYRRIRRRMLLQKLVRLEDYLAFLRKNADEVQALHDDILINVTGFFRDPESYETLKRVVFPAILAQTPPDGVIRVWVPGCSTGEEAYSIAICLLEFLTAKKAGYAIQLFGTDVSERAIATARAGIYRESIAHDVSTERLARFFTPVDRGYQINKVVRDTCVFAKQNVARDPPFSRLDLISCRNVLIYLGPVLQKLVMSVFHYSLKPGGFLLLGGSETVGAFTPQFTIADRKQRIYAKSTVPVPMAGRHERDLFTMAAPTDARPNVEPSEGVDVQREADRLMLARFGPAGVIVDERLEIVQFRGQLGPYLAPAPGRASLNLLRMARQGLAVELRKAFEKAQKRGEVTRVPDVRLVDNGTSKSVQIEVIPLRPLPGGTRYYLILFDEDSRTAPGRAKARATDARESGGLVAQLRKELDATKEYLKSIVEEQEAANEELKTANEEALSGNEELQSINEELETSKEELQSTNEELTTVNEELNNRNHELALLNTDLSNVLDSTSIPIVILGPDLRIRRFTSTAEGVLNLIPSDAGRRITDLKPNFDASDLPRLIQEVMESGVVREREVSDHSGRWHSLRIRPYRTPDHKIAGVVLALVDVDAVKRSLEELRATREYAGAIVESVGVSLVVLDGDLKVRSASRSFFETFQLEPGAIDGRPLADLLADRGKNSGLIAHLKSRATGEVSPDAVEFELPSPHTGRRIMRITTREMRAMSGRPKLMLVAMEDVTLRRRAEEKFHALLEAAPDAMVIVDATGRIVLLNRQMRTLFGYAPEELLGKPVEILMPERLRGRHPEHRAGFFADPRSRPMGQGLELWALRKDGSEIPVEISLSPLDDPEGLLVTAAIRDITERRQAESTLQELSGKMLQVRDDEQRKIARELHDSTAQKVSALAMNLAVLNRVARNLGAEERRALADSLVLADECSGELRDIASLLHPPLLDEVGLDSAIRWYAESFGRRTGIQVELTLSPKLGRLSSDIETTVFRIVQECLSNVQRHAHSPTASVQIERRGPALALEVRDKGRGMPPSPARRGGPGVGIQAMRGRVSQLGGRFDIESSAKGTRVRVSLPVSPKPT